MRFNSCTRSGSRQRGPRPLVAVTAAIAAMVLALGPAAAPQSPPMPAVSAKPPKAVDFNRDVLPILSNNCFLCHGMDSNRRMAGLRLDRPDAATAKLPSGKTAIVPGNLDASELVAR